MLHGACAASSAVADEAGGLVVPLAKQEVDGVLERMSMTSYDASPRLAAMP